MQLRTLQWLALALFLLGKMTGIAATIFIVAAGANSTSMMLLIAYGALIGATVLVCLLDKHLYKPRVYRRGTRGAFTRRPSSMGVNRFRRGAERVVASRGSD